MLINAGELLWRKGFEQNMDRFGYTWVKPPKSAVSNYTIHAEEWPALFEKYVRCGEALIKGNTVPLEDFMHNFGVPMGIEGFSSKEVMPHSVEIPSEYLAIIESDTKNAYQCHKLLEAVKFKRHRVIQKTTLSLSVGSEGARVMFDFPGAFVKSRYADNVDWIDGARRFLERVAMQYIPVLVASRTQTDEEYTFGYDIPDFKTGLWVTFLQGFPDATKPPIRKKCIQDDYHHGCGEYFYTDNPRDRLCSECKRRMNTERTRAKRARRLEKSKEQQ